MLGGFAPHVDIHHRSILVALQALIPECWKMEPGERPSSSSILSRLNYGDLGNGAAGTELNREFLFVERALFAYGDLSDLYLGRWEPPNDPKYPRGIDVRSGVTKPFLPRITVRMTIVPFRLRLRCGSWDPMHRTGGTQSTTKRAAR